MSTWSQKERDAYGATMAQIRRGVSRHRDEVHEKPAPLALPPGIHFAYLDGWKSRQEFTACQKKAARLNRVDSWDQVTCQDCLAAHARDEAFSEKNRGA